MARALSTAMGGALIERAGQAGRCPAEDSARGIPAAASRAYDFVRIDLQRPGVDRPEAVRRVSLVKTPWAQMPIAALSKTAAPGNAEDIDEAGMHAFVQKPLDVCKLAEAIALLTQPTTAPGSIETAELNQIEQKDDNDKADNHSQGGHGRILKLKRKPRP